ncbi:uncharacterized protein PG998_005333 [Apiospora kogelbergensis]|uniref:Uncharacterized protein n=1 Tax=Apiospora kogelbergensis TaxID=1337665 RepID=A0AAW0QAQ4_9PEZI
MNSGHDNSRRDGDFPFEKLEYRVQSSSLAEDGSRFGEQEHSVRHNCEHIDVNQRCTALHQSMPGFLVNLVIEDTNRAQTGQRPITIFSPCWNRVKIAVRDITFVMQCPASGELVEARPGSFYKVSIVVPQAVIPQLTGIADRDWGAIVSAYATQASDVTVKVLVERGPEGI